MNEILGRNLCFLLIDTFLGFGGQYLIFMGIELWALG